MANSSNAYKSSNPDCTPAEATRYAKSNEETARKKASTLADYQEQCDRIVQRFPSTAVHLNTGNQPQDDRFPQHSSSGVSIGRYTNATHHKDGLFSDIYRAKDSSGSSLVALKVTNPSMMTAPHDSFREARILAAAKGTNIIPLLETFPQPGGRFILVFPFVLHDLGTLLQERALPASSHRPLLQSLFSALSHLHAQKILHRDVKPSNILMASPSGPFYLADFGIAWSVSDSASEPTDNKYLEVGTTSYRAPELLFGCQSYCEGLDMWAAGCVAAQLLCLGAETLFDAGDLGSELALIKSIFEMLGTPDLETWPEAATLPDWGKMNFTKYSGKAWDEILPGVGEEARSLVSELVSYESGRRLTAKSALQHPYFQPANA